MRKLYWGSWLCSFPSTQSVNGLEIASYLSEDDVDLFDDEWNELTICPIGEFLKFSANSDLDAMILILPCEVIMQP
jgi:hypothetical protein